MYYWNREWTCSLYWQDQEQRPRLDLPFKGAGIILNYNIVLKALEQLQNCLASSYLYLELDSVRGTSAKRTRLELLKQRGN